MYADQATEQKLVQAIKEAAQRIDYSSPEDPEAILADCLTKKGLHDGFAKTAANAINKSYSVYYMSTHDDTDRDADHRLLDGDKVKMHMAKEDVPACPHTSKPVESPVIVEVKRITPVSKAASEKKEEYTPRTFKSDVEYLDWLSNGLCKFASAFDQFYADTCMATEKIYGRHKEAREMDMDDYTVQCIMSHNHRDTNELLETLGHTKKATKIAMFGTGKVQELPRIIPDNETSATIFSLVRDAGIIKTAHNSVNYMLKEAGELKDALVDLIQVYESKCLSKKAARGDEGWTGQVGSAAGAITSAAAGAIGGVPGALMNISENARMMAQDNMEGVSDNKVLDAELLKRDRKLKNLEAWTEVAADRDLARYPLTDLFEVTQKLLKANPQFERPDAAPMLIDTVKQVMSQGGQIGLAMHGATAKTLSDLAKARGGSITGNSLYDIRSAITGKQDMAEYRDISKLFMQQLSDAGESLTKGAPGIVKSITEQAIKVRDTATHAKEDKQKLELSLLKDKLDLERLKRDEENRIQAAKDKTDKEEAEAAAAEAAEQAEKDRQDKVNSILAEIKAPSGLTPSTKEEYLHRIVSHIPNILNHPEVYEALKAADTGTYLQDLAGKLTATSKAITHDPIQSPLARNLNALLATDTKYKGLQTDFLNNPVNFINAHPQLSTVPKKTK